MPDEQKPPVPTVVNFDYVKSNDFRIVHADGAFISGAAAGLNIAFYSERQPIPRRVVHKIEDGKRLGAEIVEAKVVRDALIRDVEVSLVMSLDTAKLLHLSLGEIIQKLESVKAAL